MKKRFKTKKSSKKLFFKISIFMIIILLNICFTFEFLYNSLMTNIDEKDLINLYLYNKENNIDTKNNLASKLLVSYTTGISLNNVPKKIETIKNIPVVNTNNNNSTNPIIYIYNTHQTEEYKKININEYNVTPTVLHASFILQEKLSDLGINSIVEENNIKEILNINNWNYNSSYKASKLLAIDALEKNKEIKYIIDLHRDSIGESISKTIIEDKTYAKIMLVIGSGHENYERNLEMATRINNYLKEFNETITRGIDIKKNSGIYNQDLSNTAVLIEVGGPYNDIQSVSNSLEVIANVYKKVVDEDNEKKEN